MTTVSLEEDTLTTLRRLGEEYFRIGSLSVQRDKEQLWRDLNDGHTVRPLVLVGIIPFEEFQSDELTCVSTDPYLKSIEQMLRKSIYQWKHYPGDRVFEPSIPLKRAWTSTHIGLSQRGNNIHSATVTSQQFDAQIKTMEDIEKIKVPRVTVKDEITNHRLEILTHVFGDICPIKVSAINHIWFTPWDNLIRLVGIQDIMMDMVDRPEFVEAMVERYVDVKMQELDQFEELGLLSSGNTNCRVGSGGYGTTSLLPDKKESFTCKDLWGCGNAQIFSEVSPEMHWDFSLKQEKRWLDRWGITYYGCCEQLHNKIAILDRISNLRKISISPWCDIPKARENGADKYLFSIKPNPAILAEDTFCEERARSELRTQLEQSRGCGVEVVLKDISTIRGEPQRIWRWCEIAMEEAQL